MEDEDVSSLVQKACSVLNNDSIKNGQPMHDVTRRAILKLRNCLLLCICCEVGHFNTLMEVL